jgi:tRNA pseudouridine38-40 synthase
VQHSGRLALGVAYRGSGYVGWQSQAEGHTVQDALEKALSTFAATPVRAMCAGRTDTGVHALQQVVHIDAPVQRDPSAWVRGTNTYLPDDIAVQWCVPVSHEFHARGSARARTYRYVCLESPVRPALSTGLVGWVYRPLNLAAMQQAAMALVGEHDFSSFRSSQCQSPTPVKHLMRIDIVQRTPHWHFEFEANAFLHHMVRNLMGVLVAVGQGRETPSWAAEVLAARRRDAAAPTFAPDGLYFVGPRYDERHAIPSLSTQALDWFPVAS